MQAARETKRPEPCSQLNAIQLRIADFFARRPDASNIVYVDKSNTVMPEEARIVNDNIVILKLND